MHLFATFTGGQVSQVISIVGSKIDCGVFWQNYYFKGIGPQISYWCERARKCFLAKKFMLASANFTLALETLEKEGSDNDVFYGNILRDLVSPKWFQFITMSLLNILSFVRIRLSVKSRWNYTQMGLNFLIRHLIFVVILMLRYELWIS